MPNKGRVRFHLACVPVQARALMRRNHYHDVIGSPFGGDRDRIYVRMQSGASSPMQMLQDQRVKAARRHS